jgi:hypothetical protein
LREDGRRVGRGGAVRAAKGRRRRLAAFAALACAALLAESALAGELPRAAFAPRKSRWEQEVGGREAAHARIHARLAGWPSRFLVDPAELPADDRELLWRVARDTWKGLSDLRDRENGLPIDHVRFAPGSVDPAQAEIGDYTSVTTVGLYAVAIVAARELGFIDDEETVARLRQTLGTLRELETWASMFFNYYDTTTLERTSEFISFIDSAWLTAGAMVVRATFPPLSQEVSERIQGRNHRFFYDERLELMSHGYFVDQARNSPNHYGMLYTEARLGSLIAIGKGDVPEEHWYRMTRTPPGSRELARREKLLPNGYRVLGGRYAWHDLFYVPSWGGSLFEALMPTLLVDEQAWAPSSLGRNGRVHVEVQRRYALEQLHYPVWGFSPSMAPGRPRAHAYGEYGVPVLGAQGYPADVVTPHATALALEFAPEAAVANLRRLLELYPIYGEYGFYDAVDPRSGEVVPIYLTLDQAMLFIALANHLRDGVIQQRFASDPIAARALPLLPAEDFFGD